MWMQSPRIQKVLCPRGCMHQLVFSLHWNPKEGGCNASEGMGLAARREQRDRECGSFLSQDPESRHGHVGIRSTHFKLSKKPTFESLNNSRYSQVDNREQPSQWVSKSCRQRQGYFRRDIGKISLTYVCTYMFLNTIYNITLKAVPWAESTGTGGEKSVLNPVWQTVPSGKWSLLQQEQLAIQLFTQSCHPIAPLTEL